VTPPVPPFAIHYLLRAFLGLVGALFVGYCVRTISADPQNAFPHVVMGSLYAASSGVLAWLAKLAWTKIRSVGPRIVLTLALAYHAGFGVLMLGQRIASSTSSNEDQVMVWYPHIVKWINSFE
jgi:hypothetical protein